MARKQKKTKISKHRWLMAALLCAGFLSVAVISLTSSRQATAKVIDLTDIQWEIADTEESRSQGLSGRPSLLQNQGMLFVFDEPGIYPFWMKDMKFALDIVWIKTNPVIPAQAGIQTGVVVDVATLPPPYPTALIPPAHIPNVKADRVIELNADLAQEFGLKPGTSVILPK